MNGLWRLGVWGTSFSSFSSSSSSSWFSSPSSLTPCSSLYASPSLLPFGAPPPWFSKFASSAFFSSSASSCAASSTLSQHPKVEALLKAKPHLLKPTCSFNNDLFDVTFKLNGESTNALKALKKAKFTAVADGFGFLETERPFFPDVKSSNILFVRQFYPRLFAHIREQARVVLLGNPGVSKSVFQAYYIHQLLQPGISSPNPFNSTAPPKVVLRQVGLGRMQVMFLEEEAVFTVENPGIGLVEVFNPETTEYLVEPRSDKFEPFFDGLTLPIKVSCSPDDSRYKEFTKNDCAEAFMPCWTLEELLLAGRVLREKKLEPEGVSYHEKDITERYNQFGGIIRHVLAPSLAYLKVAERRQTGAIENQADKIRIFSPFPTIEKKENEQPISHFLMQYVVDVETWQPTGLRIASPTVFNRIATHVSDGDFAQGCNTLKSMFNGLASQRPDLFEMMVADGISRHFFEWQIYDKQTQQQWQSYQFPHLKLQYLAAERTPSFSEMETGLLYRIDDARFPLVDMFFKSADDEVTGIQVTFAASHAKPRTAFEQFRERLQLPSHVRCRVLMVPDPKHAEMYARRQPAEYLATRATKDSSPAVATVENDEEERPDLNEDGTSQPHREARRKAKAEFLQAAKFDIAILRLGWPQTANGQTSK